MKRTKEQLRSARRRHLDAQRRRAHERIASFDFETMPIQLKVGVFVEGPRAAVNELLAQASAMIGFVATEIAKEAAKRTGKIDAEFAPEVPEVKVR